MLPLTGFLLPCYSCKHAATCNAITEIYSFGTYCLGTFSCSFAVLVGVCLACVWLCRVLVPVLCGCTVATLHCVILCALLPRMRGLFRHLVAVCLVCLAFSLSGTMFVHFNPFVTFVVFSFHPYS